MWLYSLENSLQPLEPHLTTLISPTAMEGLQAISRCFPDALTFAYGFEYRLHPASPTVDFAIHITEAGRSILAGLDPNVRLPEHFNRHPVWQQISKFCAAGSNPASPLYQKVADLWLEFDVDPESSVSLTNLPIPGLLFRPINPLTNPTISSDYSWIWEQALPVLLGSAIPVPLQKKLIDCLQCLPPPPDASIFQVGVMFSRTVSAIRLCLVGSPLQLLPYLSQIGWTGSIEPLEAIIASLHPYVDGIILDIDIGEQIHPKIGIEGIFLTRYLACVNGQWQALLDHLVSQNLCSPEKRNALLSYSGYTLSKPLHQRVYVRGLNHIKLIYDPEQPLAAKIYFGAMHKPISAIPGITVETATQNEVKALEQPGEKHKTSNLTIQSGITFLLAARDSKGWWIDFHLAAGLSDEWVTGYVGTLLATLPDPRIRDAINTAWNLLQTRCHRANGMWGYNRFPPGDADSTGWILQLAQAIGEQDSERSQQALESLAEHRRPNAGMSTYAHASPIRAFIHASAEQGFEGWCGSHTCVSAAIAALPQYNSQLQDYLQSSQISNGSWLAYWWHDPEYVTALAAEAIATYDPTSDCIDRAVVWGMNRFSSHGCVATSDHPSGSPFATAWCLRLLMLRQHDAAVKAAIVKATDWLVQHQQPDGSWSSSARLRVPHPDDLNPNQFHQWVYHGTIQGSLVFDERSVFTTATVLQALYRSVLASSHESK